MVQHMQHNTLSLIWPLHQSAASWFSSIYRRNSQRALIRCDCFEDIKAKVQLYKQTQLAFTHFCKYPLGPHGHSSYTCAMQREFIYNLTEENKDDWSMQFLLFIALNENNPFFLSILFHIFVLVLLVWLKN